ncbi:MAG: methyltransferase domain-containing protein [Gemmatimonadota bacterium]|jgi:SAM-dependent methyltransferase
MSDAESGSNTYEDPERAASYATLGYPGTYWLAFRDLPSLIERHVSGRRRALDFGCGAGRSTRFLQGLGFDVVGVDVSRSMLERARARDPEGRYVLVADGPGRPDDEAPGGLADVVAPGSLSLVLCAYPFDNIPGREKRAGILGSLARLLEPDGRVIVLASSPELYRHEWLSFTTAAFPENRRAGSGDPVRIVMKDVPDARPVPDYLWTDDDYRSMAAAAGLRVLETSRPLGRDDEPFDWVTETAVAPWVIHVMARAG